MFVCAKLSYKCCLCRSLDPRSLELLHRNKMFSLRGNKACLHVGKSPNTWRDDNSICFQSSLTYFNVIVTQTELLFLTETFQDCSLIQLIQFFLFVLIHDDCFCCQRSRTVNKDHILETQICCKALKYFGILNSFFQQVHWLHWNSSFWWVKAKIWVVLMKLWWYRHLQ